MSLWLRWAKNPGKKKNSQTPQLVINDRSINSLNEIYSFILCRYLNISHWVMKAQKPVQGCGFPWHASKRSLAFAWTEFVTCGTNNFITPPCFDVSHFRKSSCHLASIRTVVVSFCCTCYYNDENKFNFSIYFFQRPFITLPYNIVGGLIFRSLPPHNKTNKMTVRPAKTPISLGIRPVWSEFAVRSMGS